MDPDSICVACEVPHTECACIVASCACGERYTDAEWMGLRYCGPMFVEADEEGPAEVLVLRHCRCGSTIAMGGAA